jgi:hypothetical protein
MTRTEAIKQVQMMLETLTLIDTRTREETGVRFTPSDITDAKRTLRAHMQLLEIGAHDVAFDSATDNLTIDELC